MKFPALAFSLLLLFAVSIQARADQLAVAPIPVTHTWGDLVNSSPFELKDLPPGAVALAKKNQDAANSIPPRLWVGIDRDKVSSHGALVLYCLSQGLDFSGCPGQFGPFDVVVEMPPTDHSGIAEEFAKAPADTAAANQFYSYRIAVQAPGPYLVNLCAPVKPGRKEKPRIYAQIKVDVTAEVNPWTPWDHSPKEKALKDESPDPGTIVCNPTGVVAIPCLDNMAQTGIPVPFNKFPALDRPLPDLIPNQPDPAYRLKMEGDTLVLALKSQDDNPEMPDFYSWDDQVLTRWWVNDKPFVPALAAQDDESLDRSYKSDNPAKEVRFQLDFRPERLGAKKGDKIGVQLLYCPSGWDGNGDNQVDQASGGGQDIRRDLDLPPPEMTFLSNRVDFTYSGDPKTLQQK